MPKGLIFGMFTLIVSALMIMFLNASIGSPEEGQAARRVLARHFGRAAARRLPRDLRRRLAKLLALFAVIGLIASFHTIIFAYGRQIYSLSRAGYYLAFMSITHGTRKTPHMALFTGAAIGFAIIMAVWFVARRRERRRGHRRDAAQHGGVRRDDLVRDAGPVVHPAAQEHAEHRAAVSQPARHSRRGGDGRHRARHAVLSAAGSGVSQRRVLRRSRGTSLGILYFALFGRHKLVLSPEEEFALTGGQHGHPEREGYGTTKVDTAS